MIKKLIQKVFWNLASYLGLLAVKVLLLTELPTSYTVLAWLYYYSYIDPLYQIYILVNDTTSCLSKKNYEAG